MLYNHIGDYLRVLNLKRIIDANINRATEALRALEEIARFYLDDKKCSEKLKNMRHFVCGFFDEDYSELLKSRDTVNDVGVDIKNPTKEGRSLNIENIFKSNIKRLQQSLRMLTEYGTLPDAPRYESYTIEKEMFEGIKMNIKKYLLDKRKLYLVTNSDAFNSDDEFLDRVALAIKCGVDIIQLREKSRPAKEIIELGYKIRELASNFNTLFIVNDRIDIAKIVKADGVHLGQDDISLKTAREILGDKFIIGISTHCPDDAIKAQEGGADYIGVGPVFKTPTKPGRIPVGLEYVKWASQNIQIPFFAIGSIEPDNIEEVTKAGASRVAVVRAIMNSETPEENIKKFLSVLS